MATKEKNNTIGCIVSQCRENGNCKFCDPIRKCDGSFKTDFKPAEYIDAAAMCIAELTKKIPKVFSVTSEQAEGLINEPKVARAIIDIPVDEIESYLENVSTENKTKCYRIRVFFAVRDEEENSVITYNKNIKGDDTNE